MTDAVRCEISEHVAELVLQGPGKGNAMGPAFWQELPQVMAALDKDESVRVVLIRGNPPHFSSGLDVAAVMTELAPLLTGPTTAAERTQLLDVITRMQGAMDAVARCRKPAVAAIHGACIGAGLDLAAACDIRLCSADARFSLREVKLAIVADMGSLQRLPFIIGEAATRHLALTGMDFDAATAFRLGLVMEPLATVDSLLESARALARQVAQNPPLVTQGIKRVMNAARERMVSDGLQHVATWNAAFLQSQDLAEAMAAMMERRPPRFSGR